MMRKKHNQFFKIFAAGMTACMLLAGTPTGMSQPEIVQAAITDGNVLVDGLDRSPNYYIIPDSDTAEISSDTLANLTDSQRQMAINEIYARHGRKFVIKQVQDYFNEKSWYVGAVDADAFDVNVFNSTEEKNIEKLAGQLNYILPGSNLRYITDAEVSALTKDEQQLAINEIYARRGRKFDMKEYQDYFNAQSWYYGTIAPSDFYESVFNDYENSNISKLSTAMNSGNYASGSSSSTSSGSGIYTDFAGEYRYYAQNKEVVFQISVYTDISVADVSSGAECGTVDIMVYFSDGSMGSMSGYLVKSSGNSYTLSGKGMNGITVTVGQNAITVGNSRSINGTYEKTESYYS